MEKLNKLSEIVESFDFGAWLQILIFDYMDMELENGGLCAAISNVWKDGDNSHK